MGEGCSRGFFDGGWAESACVVWVCMSVRGSGRGRAAGPQTASQAKAGRRSGAASALLQLLEGACGFVCVCGGGVEVAGRRVCALGGTHALEGEVPGKHVQPMP